MRNDKNVSIAILCGGKSKRFGKDKTFHIVENKTLIEHVYEKVKNQSDDIFLQTSNNQENHQDRFNNLEPRIQIHHDLVTDQGALGGIYSALKHAKYQRILILAGDLPYFDRRIISELKKDEDAQLVVPRWNNGFVEPLCTIFSKEVIPVIEKQMSRNDLKINNFFNVIEIEFDNKIKINYLNINELIERKMIEPNCFKNINSLEDLE